MKAKETWKPVPSYKGLYEVSDCGRVRSLDRIDARTALRRGRVRRLFTARSGYRIIALNRDGKKRTHFVHRLVLQAFVGSAPKGCESCHENGKKADNRLANLRWGTSAANTADALRHGTHLKGERHGSAKLCNLDVWLIRELAASITKTKIARWFDVSISNVSQIVNRKTWKSV